MFQDHKQTGIGHICTGGGATIQNSPVTVNFIVNIVVENKARDDDFNIVGKILKSLGFKNDQRKIATVEIPAHAIDDDVQRKLLRHIANGPNDISFK